MRALAAFVAALVLMLGSLTLAAALTPAQESRAQRIGDQIRCPVCRGLPVTESPNELSTEMLREIREQVAAGRTDDQIYAYFASRFGENVLLNPPRRGLTLALWVLPVVALLGGAYGLARYLRSASRTPQGADPALLARVDRDLQGGGRP